MTELQQQPTSATPPPAATPGAPWPGAPPPRPLPAPAPAGWTGPSGLVYPLPAAAGSPAGTATWPTPTAPPSPPRRSGVQRLLAPVGATLAAIAKYGLVVLKLGKIGPMAISMAVSVVIFARLFGWLFGLGLVGLIFVHEMGHVIAARLERVPATLPFFLGPFGALILTKRAPRDARQDAVIGIGGPLLGTAGALLVAGLALAAAPGRSHDLLMGLAYFGFIINLFNLTPMLPFDGGRVAGAVSIWLNVAGVAIMGALILIPGTGVGTNPLLVLLFILGIVTTVQRFRTRHSGDFYRRVPTRVRAIIFVSWAGLVAITAVGQNLSHRALVEAGTLDRPGVATSADWGRQVGDRLQPVAVSLGEADSACRSGGACAGAVQAALDEGSAALAEIGGYDQSAVSPGQLQAVLAAVRTSRDDLRSAATQAAAPGAGVLASLQDAATALDGARNAALPAG